MQDAIARTTEPLRELGARALEIWLSGGWAMLAIAVIALVMFSVGTNIWLKLLAKGDQRVPERTWRRWIDRPDERRGPVGELLDDVLGGRPLVDQDLGAAFERARANETAPFERELRLMKVCVGAAPLVGLLGTVTGMLATFGALGSGGGGDETMEMVAAGISEALITTETGLVIALPGLFFQYQLTRRYERYLAFLAHIETVCMQARWLERRELADVDLKRQALREVARRIREQLARPQEPVAAQERSARAIS